MDLMYVSGQHFINDHLRESTNRIRLAGDSIKKNYFKIAHELSSIANTEIYLDDDFESAVEYAEKVFNIKKSSAYALIKIGSEWLNEDATRTILTENGSDFTFSQIGVMLPYSVDTVKPLCEAGTITPDMSVRKIKSILHEELDTTTTNDVPDESEEPEESESKNEVVLEKSIIFTADGKIKYCGEFPVWFCDKVGELFTELLSGNDPA